MSETVVIATISAVGPTIMALAAWRSAHRADLNTRTSNGHTLGRLAEKLDRQNQAQTRKIAGVLMEVSKVDEKLDEHLREHSK